MGQQPAPPSGTSQWWLTDGDAVRVRVDAGGVLLGRSPHCEVVLRHPKASRAQALIYLEGAQPRLLILGKGRTQLNQELVAREAALASGDRVSLPGLELTLTVERAADVRPGGATWVLERPGGGLFGVSDGPFVVGGHGDDDLWLVDWPHHAVTLHPTHGRLHLTTRVEVDVDGARVGAGALVALGPGSVIEHGDQRLRVVTLGQLALDNTLLTEELTAPPAVRRLRLELLPRGGRLHVALADGECCAYLPGQRCDLMTLLLEPPPPHRPGDLLEDDYLIERLWPNQSRTRTDLNTLVYRLRKDLVRAGLDASTLLLRAPGGGGTRLRLEPDAAVSVA